MTGVRQLAVPYGPFIYNALRPKLPNMMIRNLRPERFYVVIGANQLFSGRSLRTVAPACQSSLSRI